jgi:hypothetical protein
MRLGTREALCLVVPCACALCGKSRWVSCVVEGGLGAGIGWRDGCTIPHSCVKSEAISDRSLDGRMGDMDSGSTFRGGGELLDLVGGRERERERKDVEKTRTRGVKLIGGGASRGTLRLADFHTRPDHDYNLG